MSAELIQRYVALFCIVGLEVIALLNGVNGVSLGIGIGAICSIVGIRIGQGIERNKIKKGTK
jgi:hypothetical protein